MKETKSFFDNNRLNKGYSRIHNPKQSDANIIRKQYMHVLPPVDMLEAYEELNPGSLEKIFAMAEKEQHHRHSVDLLAVKKHDKAMRMGRMSALILVAIISITTLMLVIAESIIAAAIFAISAFACIIIISYCYSASCSTNKELGRNHHNTKIKSSKHSKNHRLLPKNNRKHG